MEIEKRRRGRPRKTGDTIQFWQFARAARVVCGYDVARERGEKYSAAVDSAVDFVKQLSPKTRISRTEVKRVLAAWRPRNAGTVLLFEQSIGSEEEIKKFRWILEQLAALPKCDGQSRPMLSEATPASHLKVFKVCLGERLSSPRHNRKNPKE